MQTPASPVALTCRVSGRGPAPTWAPASAGCPTGGGWRHAWGAHHVGHVVTGLQPRAAIHAGPPAIDKPGPSVVPACQLRAPPSCLHRGWPVGHRPLPSPDRRYRAGASGLTIGHESYAGSVAEPIERAFAFVDLAGFTALTEAHGDATAVDLVGRFVALADQAVKGRGDLVKSIGDAVMLSFDDPANALVATQLLVVWSHNSGGFPMLRAGLHDGPALPRAGDWFGATVNLAARVAGRARGGQTLGTTRIAQTARDQGLAVAGVGSVEVHNIARPVELFEINLLEPAVPPPVDPVCRMAVDRDRAQGRLRHQGRDFWFCSMRCAAAFAAGPDRYTGETSDRRPTPRSTVDGHRLS